MINSIKIKSVLGPFLFLLSLSTALPLGAQDNPEGKEFGYMKLLGTWEGKVVKTEPDSLKDSPDFDGTLIANWQLTADSLGVLQTNRGYIDDKEVSVGVGVAFHDFEKNETHHLGAGGKSIISYPDENILLIKHFSFDGSLFGTQTVTLKSDQEFEALMEYDQGGTPVKVWFLAKRLE